MKRLISVSEVSEKLGIRVSTTYKYVCARKIPFVKLNGHLKFDEEAIELWIEKNSTPANTTAIGRAS